MRRLARCSAIGVSVSAALFCGAIFCISPVHAVLLSLLTRNDRPGARRKPLEPPAVIHGRTNLAVDKELEAQILRYHHVEQWRVGTIARQLGVHHGTVDRVLSQAGMPKAERTRQASIIDPYIPFIIETLAQYPTLTATRLYAMAQQRGYPGGSSHFRSHVAQLRPRKPSEAYLRLRTLPGEQGQVDWGHFNYVQIGRAKRPLMAFVMVLSWSRQIFLRFYLNQRMESFLRGHVAAFEAWGALPRVLLYDNLKSAVLERREDAIRFHPTLLAPANFGRI